MPFSVTMYAQTVDVLHTQLGMGHTRGADPTNTLPLGSLGTKPLFSESARKITRLCFGS